MLVLASGGIAWSRHMESFSYDVNEMINKLQNHIPHPTVAAMAQHRGAVF